MRFWKKIKKIQSLNIKPIELFGTPLEEETTFKDFMSIPTGYLTCGRYWRRRYWRGRFWRRHQFLFRENPIQYQMWKNRINNFVTQFYEISHSISIARIRINNFVTQLDEIPYWRVKTEERRRRFQKSLRNIQDIHCRNFALHNLTEFRIIQFDETFVAQFDEISHYTFRYTIWRNFALYKFRIAQFDEISQTWRRRGRNQFRKRRNQLSVLSFCPVCHN